MNPEDINQKSAEFQANEILTYLNQTINEMSDFSKKTIQLKFDYKDTKQTVIPCTILKGNPEKQVLWIQAVIHGDEYDGAIACLRIIENIDLKDLYGTILLLPLINPSAFFAYQHGSPYDGNVNLNRVFCDNDNHSYSWEYGRFLFKIISNTANFVIDYHGASKLNDISRFAGTSDMGNPIDEYVQKIARRIGVDYILLDSNTQKGNNRGRLNVALSDIGIPAIILENGGGLSWTEEAVERHLFSVYQIMYEAGFVKKGETIAESGEFFIADDYIYFDIDGLLVEHIPVGTDVNSGDVCLKVMNVETQEIQDVCCQKDGCFVFCVHTAAVVKKGDIAYTLARKVNV